MTSISLGFSFSLQSLTPIRLMKEEREQIEAEKKTLAEEKSDIDNELSRIVEQKLEMQQEKQAFEDRESELISIIKEKDTKIEEITHSLAEERKQVIK